MIDNDTKRISRLTAILTLLQSKRLWTAKQLANKFFVSTRTIYRDIRALEQAGIPIVAEEGKGYSIMEGYRIPPVMFTEKEAFALITAEQIILQQKDASFKEEYTNAAAKIKSVLRNFGKAKAELIAQRIFVGKNFEGKVTSSSLMDIQIAIAGKNLIKIDYTTEKNISSSRTIEPYMLYHNEAENWTLLAHCRYRADFRTFRLDRINRYSTLHETFEPDENAFKKYIKKKFLN